MKFGWFEMLLAVLATIVATVVGRWAWDTFKAWRINREYGPKNRRGPTRGRRMFDGAAAPRRTLWTRPLRRDRLSWRPSTGNS